MRPPWGSRCRDDAEHSPRLPVADRESVYDAQADSGADIRFADPGAAFTGHGLCDSEAAFINALLFEGLGLPPGIKQESFHPTVEGQEALRETIEEAGRF